MHDHAIPIFTEWQKGHGYVINLPLSLLLKFQNNAYIPTCLIEFVDSFTAVHQTCVLILLLLVT
jgi:hypothetical protein